MKNLLKISWLIFMGAFLMSATIINKPHARPTKFDWFNSMLHEVLMNTNNLYLTNARFAPPSIRFSGWENGTGRLDSYWSAGSLFNSPYDLMVVGSDSITARSGSFCARFETRFTDTYPLDGGGKPVHPRAEVQRRADSNYAGYHTTYKFSQRTPIYLPQNDVVPYIIAQMHDAGAIGSPYWAITIFKGYYWFGTNAYNLVTGVRTQKAWRLFPVVKGVWHDWQVYQKMRLTPDGHYTLWHNGQIVTGTPVTPSYGNVLTGAAGTPQLLDIAGANLNRLENGAKDFIPYIKIGIYIWNLYQSNVPPTTVSFMDDFSMIDSTGNPVDYLPNYVDSTPPSVPTGVNVTSLAATSFTANWTASTGTPSGYDVLINDVYYGSTAGTSLAITGRISYTNYTVKVRSKDAAGNVSAYSSGVTVRTLDNISPTQPTLAVTGKTETSAELAISGSTDNSGTIATYWLKTNGGSAVNIGAGTNYSADGLTANTFYSFTVQAADAAGNLSTNSAAATVTTLSAPDVTAPTVPTNLSASGVSFNYLTLGWVASTDVTGVVAYKVYRDGVFIGQTPNLYFYDASLVDNVSYSYTVSAIDAAGNESAQSTALVVKTPYLRPAIDPFIIIQNIIPKN